MLASNNEDWLITNGKRIRSEQNRELVTARINIINKRKVVKLSIGLVVCGLIGFKQDDRVHIFIHKDDRNLLLVKKDEDNIDGYRLSKGQSSGTNFLSFAFRCETQDSFRLSQTVILDYDFNDEGVLIVDFEKIKWRK